MFVIDDKRTDRNISIFKFGACYTSLRNDMTEG